MARKQRDPLAPIDRVTLWLLAFAILGLVFTGISQLSRPADALVPPLTPGTSCVEVDNGSAVFLPGTKTLPERDWDLLGGRLTSAQAVPHTIAVCSTHVTHAQRWWAQVAWWPMPLFDVGALALVRLLAYRARRQGFFTPVVARGLSRLGIYLAVGSVVATLINLVARKQLLDSLVSPSDLHGLHAHGSVATVVAGAGLVTLGRVMAHAVAMREELDATV